MTASDFVFNAGLRAFFFSFLGAGASDLCLISDSFPSDNYNTMIRRNVNIYKLTYIFQSCLLIRLERQLQYYDTQSISEIYIIIPNMCKYDLFTLLYSIQKVISLSDWQVAKFVPLSIGTESLR